MRKTYKDYKKQYDNIIEKQKAIESRIKQRAKEMVKNQPGVKMNNFESNRTVSEQFNTIENKLKPEYKTKQFLRIIKVIEQYNEKKSGIKQLKMFE
jgi:molybdopterin-biosynthesis enzyme MoeA-like protein